MSTAIVTGAGGLVGAEAVRLLAARGLETHGVDNDMRGALFGPEASTRPSAARLAAEIRGHRQHDVDIRDAGAIERLFADLGRSTALIVHCAGQPSHEWAAGDPATDFAINATGTLNLLEAARRHCPEAVFIYTSSNRVYGDAPNRLPLRELETRWEIDEHHPFHARGIDESMPVDQCLHSLMGVSKLAGDVLVQEYGRYFGMATGVFRGGCLTGPGHAGTEEHGFLAYLMKCAATGRAYRILGCKGKQVRDNLHVRDLVQAFWRFYEAPRHGEVYNIGGGRFSHCSLREAILLCEQVAGRPMHTSYVDEARPGDHLWWVTDTSKFSRDYPGWTPRYAVPDILRETYEANREAWT